MKKHKHFWFYPPGQIQGRTEHEIVVVRYCQCGVRQMAYVSQWRPATGDYKRDEHYT
jgi:hypothetical protein